MDLTEAHHAPHGVGVLFNDENAGVVLDAVDFLGDGRRKACVRMPM